MPKRCLFRGGQSPFDMLTMKELITRNSIGNNSGNLLYAQGVIRTLMTSKNTVFTPNYYRYATLDAEKINEQYDMFVIPLADAFRPGFREVGAMTRFVRKLRIPAVVIGVGLRAPYDYVPGMKFPFDDSVKAFVSAVLEHSAMVGVRGAITSEYLSGLGFTEGRDHMAIGCPSLYTWGRELNVREPDISPDSKVCINATVTSNMSFTNDFIFEQARRFKEYHFIPQLIDEYRLGYAGLAYQHNYEGYYPTKLSNKEYREDRVHFFKSAMEWFDFTGQMDFSFGGRIHGNIAALLGGTPSLLFTKDARTRELAEYHALPSFPETVLSRGDSIFNLVEKADFSTYKVRQRENFDRYIGFLERNGLEHIYQHDVKRGKAPFDIKMKKEYRPKEAALITDTKRSDMMLRLREIEKDNFECTRDRVRATRLASQLGGFYNEAQKCHADIILDQAREWEDEKPELMRRCLNYRAAKNNDTVSLEMLDEIGLYARSQLRHERIIGRHYRRIKKKTRTVYRVRNVFSIVKRKVRNRRKVDIQNNT